MCRRGGSGTGIGDPLADLPDPLAHFGLGGFGLVANGLPVLEQRQSVAVNQAGSIGGFNAVASHQTQNGISGQVSLF